MSGIYHVDRFPWRQSQRDRLSSFVTDRPEEEIPVLSEAEVGRGATLENWRKGELVDRLFDVGLVKEVSAVGSLILLVYVESRILTGT